MSKQYAVIGLGKFGFSVATTLAQAGKEVLAVDKDAEPVQEIADLVTYAARADITDSRVFASLGISNMDVVFSLSCPASFRPWLRRRERTCVRSSPVRPLGSTPTGF